MPINDDERMKSNDACSINVFLFLCREHTGSYRPGILGPFCKSDHQHDCDNCIFLIKTKPGRRLEYRQDYDGDHQGGEGQLNISHAHEEAVKATAEVSGHQTNGYADDQLQACCKDTDQN